MNLFEIVKYGVSCREAAERYGVEVNHYGMALCPFHNDRHPSLYVADDHYHCFACGEHGDVIDFVGKLFQLSPYDAAQKLMADFHLSPDKPPSAAALHAKRIRTEAQQLMPQHLRALLSSSAQVSVASVLETACDLPAQTCHRQLYRRDGQCSGTVHFLFCERETEKRNRGKRTMAIYHLEAKVVSRGAGRSAVAVSAYLSCSRLYSDYDGMHAAGHPS